MIFENYILAGTLIFCALIIGYIGLIILSWIPYGDKALLWLAYRLVSILVLMDTPLEYDKHKKRKR